MALQLHVRIELRKVLCLLHSDVCVGSVAVSVKAIAFSALWGYGIATIIPIEKVIFHTNLHLAQQDNTRIGTNQLMQLSADVLSDVNNVFSSRLAVDSESEVMWQLWRDRQRESICERNVYELNLSVIGVVTDGTACREGS